MARVLSLDPFLKRDALPLFWCGGCGNGITLGAIIRSMKVLGWTQQNTVVVTGIGCWGKADDYITTNALHGTHGRALAFATGIKAANSDLNVIVLMGDGDAATIGGNHLIHAARRNINVTAIISNNYNYGMTGGQYSGTTPVGLVTTTSPYGHAEEGFDLCDLAVGAGAPFVARGTVYHVVQLEQIIERAMVKEGFSVVDVASPCPTYFGRYNRLGSAPAMLTWLKETAVGLHRWEQLGPEDRAGRFPIGILKDEDRPDFCRRYEEVRTRAQAPKGVTQ